MSAETQLVIAVLLVAGAASYLLARAVRFVARLHVRAGARGDECGRGCGCRAAAGRKSAVQRSEGR